MDRRLLDYSPENEAFDAGAIERGENEWAGEASAEEAFGEFEEMDLAAGLLEVTSETEFDRFLGGLIDRAGRAAGSVARSPAGRTLAGILKHAAKLALPAVGRAIEQRLGGADIGAQAMRAAENYFGLELEGLSPEDQEFEAAKSFVRFAGEAANNIAAAPAGAPPEAAAQAAAVRAARRYAPGLLSNTANPRSAKSGAQFIRTAGGRWVRRGPNIIVIDDT